MTETLENTPTSTGSCDSGDCPDHYHANDTIFMNSEARQRPRPRLTDQPSTSSGGETSDATLMPENGSLKTEEKTDVEPELDPDDRGFQRIIRNFTPSWFIITMSTGILSTLLHQLPYNGHWLQIISVIFFVLNICLFILFTIISAVRYTLYPKIFPAVLRHPHQSLFLATFPVGLATIVNMIVLVCVPVWGHGMATLAWVLWWIVSVIALTACFHLTYVIMSNQRSELAEMTALYFIPIVSVVIAATCGGLVAGALPNPKHQLWTLIISYIFWGIGTPLSWIILTLYFLRLTLHKPLSREAIVTLLLPIGPLGLSGFSIIVLGKLAKHLFPITNSLPHVAHAGDVFYIIGVVVGLILWGFAIVWFVVASIMIALARNFPFNMGWWGFVFPVGVFTLQTFTIGEELESRFFKVLGAVLTVVCVIMWIGIAAGTVQRSINGKMFFAPCLGTDLYQRRWKGRKMAAKVSEKEEV